MAFRLPDRYDTGLITDAAELKDLTDRLADEAKPVAFDVETSYEGQPRADAAKHPEENFICGFSLTNSLSWARAVPIAFESGPNIDPEIAARCLHQLAQARDAQGRPLLVSHNAAFESRCTARLFEKYLGIPLADSYFEFRSDTMVEAYIEAEHESYALKSLTWETFGIKMTEIMELFGDKLTKKQQDSIQFHLLDQASPQVIAYMCDDAHKALAHHLLRYPAVTDPKFRGAFLFKVDMGQIPLICAMEDVGIAYDWNRMREASQRGKAFMDKLAAEINADISAKLGRQVSFSLASPAQVAKVLYEDLGLPARHRSKITRKPSTGKDAIRSLARDHPEVKKLQDWRRIKRLCADNYAGKYEKDYSYAPDGRAHPNILQCAATTGRFAFSRPAAQQPPKKVSYTLATGETFEFAWRDCITVPPPGSLGDIEHFGWYILGFDVSQAELRALAGEAGETALIEAFARGDDVHRLTAALMLGKPLGQVTDEDRSLGKTLNFATAYQQGPDRLAESLGISKDEGQRLLDAWFDAYPQVRAWTARTVTQARKDGYTTSRFGRKHPIWEFVKTCPDGHKWRHAENRCPSCGQLGMPKSPYIISHGERLAGNAPIQGGATGDMMRVAMVRADKALRAAGLRDKVHLYLNVHDSLDFYVRKDVPPAVVIRVLQPAVVFPITGWPPMVIDWHLGLRMGSLRELEVGPDWSVRVKGVKEETAVPDDEDDEAEPPAVDLAAVKAAASRTEVRDVPAETAKAAMAPEAVAVDPDGLDHAGVVAGGPDPAGRTVIITVPAVPGKDAAMRLRAALGRQPGPNTVILRTPAGEVTVPGTSGLTPANQADVAFILGAAQVTYDTFSVDYAAIADGLI